MRVWLMLVLMLLPAGLQAQDRVVVLSVPEVLITSGFTQYLLPRFALKHQIRVTAVADTVDQPSVVDGEITEAASGKTAFHHASGAPVYRVHLMSVSEYAQTFRDWLLSDIGQNTVAGFRQDGEQVYLPGGTGGPVAAEVLPEGDHDEGDRLAHFHCGRCHVISDRNRYGGIGSTPSFPALRSLADWEDKFRIFWSLNPHPSFTQVEGLTEPFNPLRPPHIAPVLIGIDDLDAILAFVGRMEPKDLGAGVISR